uniref:Uncharacterized protein n=1 Tax=Rhizophora mucronata TaxID=61149 RepID=A0A2P2J0V9_RHIMU
MTLKRIRSQWFHMLVLLPINGLIRSNMGYGKRTP